jgi:plastocyanin
MKLAAPMVESMKKATDVEPLAGTASPDVRGIVVHNFEPRTISVPVGGSVTWTIGGGGGGHTVSFNAPAGPRTGFMALPDGTIQRNAATTDPINSPPVPALTTAPVGSPENSPTAPPIVVDGGSWDGQGILSSGTVRTATGGQRFAYKVTFTKAGTYLYACLIHPGMDGVVKVGN